MIELSTNQKTNKTKVYEGTFIRTFEGTFVDTNERMYIEWNESKVRMLGSRFIPGAPPSKSDRKQNFSVSKMTPNRNTNLQF